MQLQAQDISKSFGLEPLFENVSFVINSGERVGLIGPNGSGKSTLLTILAGLLTEDRGQVALSPGTTIGYLPQGMELEIEDSVRDVIEAGIPDLRDSREQLDALTQQMESAGGQTLALLIERYGEAQRTFETLGGYDINQRSAETLAGLNLEGALLDRKLAELSGGQKSRVGLARVLISEPNLLLLDEPTNHLDIQALEWLEDYLSHYAGAVVIVSHDRTFLDRTLNRVLALEPETRSVRAYPGGYSDYAREAARELADTWDKWREQSSEIRKMEQDIHRTKHHALRVELTTTPRQPNVRRLAKKVAKKAKSREKKLTRYRDDHDRVEKPRAGWQMKLEFDESMRSGQSVLHVEDLGHRYADGPKVFGNLQAELRYGEHVALLGPNGSGKSTLIKLVVGQLEPTASHVKIGGSVKIGYMPQEQQNFDLSKTLVDIIQTASAMNETEARNFLHYFLFAGEGALNPVSNLSYGERARLTLGRLVAEGANFLVLDEPINHLDIPSRERFESALRAFPGTILAVAHDRTFVKNIANKIWRLEVGGLRTEWPKRDP